MRYFQREVTADAKRNVGGQVGAVGRSFKVHGLPELICGGEKCPPITLAGGHPCAQPELTVSGWRRLIERHDAIPMPRKNHATTSLREDDPISTFDMR
jgi:hypothetical protein